MSDESGTTEPAEERSLEERLADLEAENARLREQVERTETDGGEGSLSDAFTRLWNRLAGGE